MLETPHVVVGAAIAYAFPNPVISLPLAFLSHFVLDKVPHWNPHLNTEIKKKGKPSTNSTLIVIADVILALIFGFIISFLAFSNPYHSLVILLASFVAVLPDVVEGPYFFFGQKNKTIESWIKFQKSIQNDTSIIPGLTIQVLTIIFSFLWVLN